jgi:N-sulfoglucosamine sulfohydrolase
MMTTMKNKLLLAAAMVFLASANGFAEAGQRPNILWIIAEDMSPDIGCYGNKLVSTPNIDQLAARGMKFNNVFTTGPACSPSRTSLATGVYQTTLGAFHMRYSDELKPVLPEPVRILPELMREQGYYTGNIREVCNTGTGKDDWLFNTSQKSWDTHSWVDLTEQQPFFAQINFTESHRGFKPNKTTPVAKGQIELPPYYPDHPVSRQDWAGYLEEVNTADERIGAILKKLEQDNLARNTIIFFFSDHGRPMIRGKNWLYDSGTRIPLVIYYPEKINQPDGYQAGNEHSGLISSVDMVAETLLMAGGRIPDWMQGRSFLREDSTPRKYVYTAVDRIGNIDSCSRAVRTRNFKYIKNFKTPGSINESSTAYRRATHPIYHLLNIMGDKGLLTPVQAQLLKPLSGEELYDLEIDPYETVNLVGNKDFEAVRKELEDKLSEWIVLSKDKGLEKDSEAIIQHFRAYGVSTGKKQKNRIRKMRSSVEKHFDDSLHN